MQRAIVHPAGLGGAALDELKQWLGITQNAEDLKLLSLLQAGLEICEAFTGQLPIEVDVKERLETASNWQRLSSLPVRAVTAVELIGTDGLRQPLAGSDYEIDIGADAIGSVRLLRRTSSGAMSIDLRAGIAPDWPSLPDALRHGIIRLAAYHYRERDMEKPLTPPASVAALWRPWRLMRLT